MDVKGSIMSNETEKITINLGVVDLAQVDVLVEQGLYANRSDFIRTAIRKDLESHKETIERAAKLAYDKPDWGWFLGISNISRKTLEEYVENGRKMKLSGVGMLVVDKSIDAELFEKAVERVVVRGKLVADKEIRKIIDGMK